jgi:hypothetical protein
MNKCPKCGYPYLVPPRTECAVECKPNVKPVTRR